MLLYRGPLLLKILVGAALQCYGRQDEVITLVESSTKLARSDVDQHTQYVPCLFKLDSLSCWLENLCVGGLKSSLLTIVVLF